MQHFPIFLAVTGKRIVLSGAGDAAVAKLRLILKTEADVFVYGDAPHADIVRLAAQGKLTLEARPMQACDVIDAALFYGANEDATEDARTAKLAHAAGALVNIVDNLADSAFITPAIVDRDPVTVAIGTEGAAPVLARAIKADLEASLPENLGTLARIGKTFRHAVDVLPFGRKRRSFWSDFYFNAGPSAVEAQGPEGVLPALEALLDTHVTGGQTRAHVDLVGAGPGDPDLLTLKARKAVDRADVVVHDGDVPAAILELARREATVVNADNCEESAQAVTLAYAADGAHVVRLKLGAGTPDSIISACAEAGVSYQVIPGLPKMASVTSAQPQARPALKLHEFPTSEAV